MFHSRLFNFTACVILRVFRVAEYRLRIIIIITIIIIYSECENFIFFN